MLRELWEIQFHLSEADYVSANWAYLKHNPWRFLRGFRYPIGTAVVAIVVVVQRWDMWQSAAWVFALGVGEIAYFLIVYRWKWHRLFQKMSFGHRLVSATIDSETVKLRGDRREVTRRWDEFSDIYESYRLFMFKAVDGKVLFLPKAAMNEMQIQEMRSLVSSSAKCKVQLASSAA